jgi:hypothetical protein
MLVRAVASLINSNINYYFMSVNSRFFDMSDNPKQYTRILKVMGVFAGR